MSFDFTENFTVVLPDFSEYQEQFSESFNLNKALIIEVAAIHEGLTSNYNFYSKEDLEKSLNSWVEPYPKPIILNHDLNSEPFGRVMAAKMDEEDGSSFVRLQIAITDPVAAQKIMDQRYLTGSVGGRAGKAICSISGEDLASESSGRPGVARYARGKVYKGKLAYIKMEDISFKEYSFVNQPADQKSGVRKINPQDPSSQGSSSSEDWVAKSSAFILHMDKEEIISVEENECVLKKLKKKEAHPTYLSLKGAFLTALAVHESETDNNNTESLLYDDSSEKIESQEKEKMAKVSQEEDILAVANGLSEDLSSIAASSGSVDQENQSPEDEEDEATGEEGVDSSSTTDESSAGAEGTSSSDTSEEADVQDEIVDSEKTEESKDDSEEDSEDLDSGAEDTSEESEGDAVQAQEDELIANNSSNELSQELEDLKSKVTALENENTQLKNALHRTLVERVVDAKISSGLESINDRESLIEEHSTRTPSSLADTLRDIAKLPAATKTHVEMPEVSSETEVVSTEKNVFTIGKEDSKEVPKEDMIEQLLVDALMGRRKL